MLDTTLNIGDIVSYPLDNSGITGKVIEVIDTDYQLEYKIQWSDGRHPNSYWNSQEII